MTCSRCFLIRLAARAYPWAILQNLECMKESKTTTNRQTINRQTINRQTINGQAIRKEAQMKIILQGTFNTRDLGGIKTEDGRTVKPNRLIRSDALFEITKEDEAVLRDECGVGLIIDLRTDNEMSEQSPRKIEGVKWIHLPLLKGGNPAARESGSDHRSEEGKDDAGPQTQDKTMAQVFRGSIAQMNYDVPSAMMNMYSHIFSDPFSIGAIRKFFDLLLDMAGSEGALLWHCTAGKDRTGVLALLLLGILGVSKEDILDDYLISDENLRPQTEGLISEIRKETDDELLIEQARILNSVLPEYVDAMFGNIREAGGDITGYMKKVIGLSDEDIEKLKAGYLI